MFPRRQDPKCGHNLCCHKLTPIISPFVLLVFPFSCFPLNACSIPGGRKACLFRLVWSLSGCSTVSFICPKNYTVFPSVWSRVHRGLEDTKVAFTSNFRSQRPMRVFTRSSWETTEAEIRALSVWPMQVKCLSWIFAEIQTAVSTVISDNVTWSYPFFSPGYQAVLNELFRVIGESLSTDREGHHRAFQNVQICSIFQLHALLAARGWNILRAH